MLLRIRPRGHPFDSFLFTRQLSSRAQRVLSALNLPTDDQPIAGVFDGQWSGTGDVLESRCPATGEIIGRVRGVSLS